MSNLSPKFFIIFMLFFQVNVLRYVFIFVLFIIILYMYAWYIWVSQFYSSTVSPKNWTQVFRFAMSNTLAICTILQVSLYYINNFTNTQLGLLLTYTPSLYDVEIISFISHFKIILARCWQSKLGKKVPLSSKSSFLLFHISCFPFWTYYTCKYLVSDN